MALNIQELKNSITGAFGEPDTSEVAQGQFADAVREYILSNAIITGVYTGVMSNGNPDPLSGSYIWQFESMDGMTSDIGGNINNLSDWESNLKDALETLTVQADDNGVPPVVELDSTPSITITTFSIGDMSDITTFEGAAGHLAEKIITALYTAVIADSVIASTAQGDGTVLFGSLS